MYDLYDCVLILICFGILVETVWDHFFGTPAVPATADKINIIKIECPTILPQNKLNKIVHKLFKPETVYCDGCGTYYLFYYNTHPNFTQVTAVKALRADEFSGLPGYLWSVNFVGFAKKKKAIIWLQTQLTNCKPSLHEAYYIKISGNRTDMESFANIPLTNTSQLKKFIFDRPIKKTWQRAHKRMHKQLRNNDDKIINIETQSS